MSSWENKWPLLKIAECNEFQVAVIRKSRKTYLISISLEEPYIWPCMDALQFPNLSLQPAFLSCDCFAFRELQFFQRAAVIETMFEQLLPGYLTFIARLPGRNWYTCRRKWDFFFFLKYGRHPSVLQSFANISLDTKCAFTRSRLLDVSKRN